MTFEVQNYLCRGHNQAHLLVSNGHISYSPRSARPKWDCVLSSSQSFFSAFVTAKYISKRTHQVGKEGEERYEGSRRVQGVIAYTIVSMTPLVGVVKNIALIEATTGAGAQLVVTAG